MTPRYKKLEELQKEIVESIGTRGTAEVATGVGKTFIAFKWLYRWVPIGSTVTFFAEVSVRENTIEEEMDKFKEIYGKDVRSDFKVGFQCYQAMKSARTDAHVYDEVHEMLSPVYQANYFDNLPEHVLGISATIPDTPVEKDDFEGETKRQLLNRIAPIKYTYSLTKGIEDGILSPYKLCIVEHELDCINKKMIGGTKKRPMPMTEREYHDFYESKRTNHFLDKHYRIMCGGKVMRLLQSTNSVIPTAQKLLEKSGRTVVFGINLDVLEAIAPGKVVSSRKKEAENEKIISDFNSGKTNVIASFKMLKQGINLDGVESCIIVSYYSKEKDFVQQLGRVVRFVEGKTANVYLLAVKHSPMQERWRKLMLQNFNT